MPHNIMTRRNLLASTAVVAAGIGYSSRPSTAQSVPADDDGLFAYKPNESDFPFEVVRTEAEWREHLDNDDLAYEVLRLGETETPKTTDLWLVPHEAGYMCRGCDLPLYEARWFQFLDKGWVFFHHAVAHSVMFGIDGPVAEYGQAGMLDENNVVSEVHCRRCGSHIGHHLKVSGMILHCINGTALKLA